MNKAFASPIALDRLQAKSLSGLGNFCCEPLTLAAPRPYSGGEWEKVG
jgi:hypothetical protein